MLFDMYNVFVIFPLPMLCAYALLVFQNENTILVCRNVNIKFYFNQSSFEVNFNFLIHDLNEKQDACNVLDLLAQKLQ